jgi:hypothetical protein
MPSAIKDLSLLNSSIELMIDSGTLGRSVTRGSFQYIQGTGTITLQATLQVTNPAVWFDIVNDLGVDIDPITSVGVTNFPLAGYVRIRAINTTGGSGNLSGLGFN